jgi:hypothetical protein
MSDAYEAPKFVELGSLEEMTLQSFNKIGPAPDLLTQVDPNVIGSFTPVP